MTWRDITGLLRRRKYLESRDDRAVFWSRAPMVVSGFRMGMGIPGRRSTRCVTSAKGFGVPTGFCGDGMTDTAAISHHFSQYQRVWHRSRGNLTWHPFPNGLTLRGDFPQCIRHRAALSRVTGLLSRSPLYDKLFVQVPLYLTNRFLQDNKLTVSEDDRDIPGGTMAARTLRSAL